MCTASEGEMEVDMCEPPLAYDGHIFKTPMKIKTSNHLSVPKSEDSCYSSIMTPDYNSSSSSLSSISNWSFKPPLTISTPYNSYNYYHSISESDHHGDGLEHKGLGVNLLKRMEISHDSGIGCESFSHSSCAESFSQSCTESADAELDVASASHLPRASAAQGYKRPATPMETKPSKQFCPHVTPGVPLTEEPVVWQSTPAQQNSRGDEPVFGTPSASPPKHRRSLFRPSRDIFQRRPDKEQTTSASCPLMGDYPVGPSPLRISSVGRETIDFLSYLGKHSVLQAALDAILGHLSPADLCRATLVSHSWKSIIDNIPSLKLRKRAFVKQRAQCKENVKIMVKKTEDLDTFPHRGRLLSIQNLHFTSASTPVTPRSPPVSPSKVRFNLFLKEGRKLENGQTLVPCPQCKLPSRRESEISALCTRRGCQYHFCLRCLCKFHNDKPCPVSVKHRKRQVAIGSRESRRNLQRLCR